MRDTLIQIASKAEYIHDLATAILHGKTAKDIDCAFYLYDVLRQLESIADTIDELHNWDDAGNIHRKD